MGETTPDYLQARTGPNGACLLQGAIAVTDVCGAIIRVNAAFEEITGYSADEVIGLWDSDEAGIYNGIFGCAMSSAMASDGFWCGEVLSRQKCGGVITIWITVAAAYNPQDELTHYLVSFSNISERKKAEEQLTQLHFFDPVTGLPNRRHMIERIDAAQTVALRSGQFGALLKIDLDHFRVVNDLHGYAYGDQVLRRSAALMQDALGEEYTIARVSADEFVVVLEGLSLTHGEAQRRAGAIAENVRAALARHRQSRDSTNEAERSLSASIGLVLFGDHMIDAEELMRRADLALCQAKEAGRNAVCAYNPLMQSALEAKTQLEDSLRRALDEAQFELHYQPQVDKVGVVVGCEALIRWRHPNNGLVGPGGFIPIAEETGMIVPIGRWVLSEAIAQLARWRSDPRTRELVLSINVSACQFRHPDFVADVVRLAHAAAVDLRRLKLEITESVLLEDLRAVQERMRALKDLGVTFALDDFGTGYSSLTYLRRLPFDQIKIDRSFIEDLPADNCDASIVRAILAMGSSLNIDVVAEGVETMEQHRFLVEHGCPLYQGFLFGRPSAAAARDVGLRARILNA